MIGQPNKNIVIVTLSFIIFSPLHLSLQHSLSSSEPKLDAENSATEDGDVAEANYFESNSKMRSGMKKRSLEKPALWEFLLFPIPAMISKYLWNHPRKSVNNSKRRGKLRFIG
ncbi:hypothetical protein HELRODRAFT_168749 [Helobdella robusta]|uniref:Transmembrane protein n=1 Tax=Helobdella robusta TaxID=6412 RepID=T1F0X2_HELRO|nr:hypothetical protein HELRODRAFT_168749 [Helobdella robusta]ESO08838.1 hypothetical protein HELRODRAFT_168749 [Helobdella robusta]